MSAFMNARTLDLFVFTWTQWPTHHASEVLMHETKKWIGTFHTFNLYLWDAIKTVPSHFRYEKFPIYCMFCLTPCTLIQQVKKLRYLWSSIDKVEISLLSVTSYKLILCPCKQITFCKISLKKIRMGSLRFV